MAKLISVRGFEPKIAASAYLVDESIVIGDVEIGEDSSVWFNVTIRGDVMPIRIGNQVNIQDGSVLHGTFKKCGVVIEDRVTIGHNVTLHGCKIGKECLIGMGSIVMDQASIGEYSILGAGSLVTEGTVIPPRSLAMGRPAKVIRELSQEEIETLKHSADNYLLYKTWYTGGG